jgi:hypothetical protein
MSEEREFGWQAACDLEEMVVEKNRDQGGQRVDREF